MGNGNPRFRKKQTRVQIALAKYYGMGDDDPWTIERIANYLEVDKSTVSNYVNNTELADAVEEQLAEAQARTRMRLAMKLLDRLDNLEEMIDAKSEAKKPQVVSHKIETVQGELDAQVDGYNIDTDQEIKMDVPIPDHFKEVPKVDSDMKTLMREWRMTVQEIEDLLGLEAPDQIESEHREIQVEAKLWDVNTDDADFPEQEVLDSQPQEPPAEIEIEPDEDG